MQSVKRITKIIDEVSTYFMSRRNISFDINIRMNEDRTILIFTAFDYNISKSELEDMENALRIPRQVDAEEFYWQLNGTSESESEFDLVGMMTDDYEIEVSKNEFRLTLFRKI